MARSGPSTSVAVWSDTPDDERRVALTDLAARKVNVVFSVDLFNEGVDVPVVDTLLLLRPTDSPTLFLQQLGRGLRRAEGKTACGRLLHLDDMERIKTYRRFLAADSPPALQGLPPPPLLRGAHRDAPLPSLRGGQRLASDEAISRRPGDLSARDHRLLRMLISSLVTEVKPRDMPLAEREACLQAGESLALGHATTLLWSHPQIRSELTELLDVLATRINHLVQPLTTHPDIPQEVHARYLFESFAAAVA